MKRLRLGYGEIFFVVLIVLTVAARIVDAWPASSREIDAVRTLAASNGAARSFVTASLSAEGSPSRREVRRWRVRVLAIDAAATRSGWNASGQATRSAEQGAEIGAEHK
ncbi:hypothetical protein DWV00_10860 [Trinickia dinghuensis]|uniref:Uncharacterized protein n=1 Tax=Trinickia dinghuensis TaxID=2291023 RepID=A0A3D8K2G5_9BURK|nr:hypothetical protein DWV00_10860 [Trinickia dinghuensis]